MSRPNGFIAFEGPSAIDGAPIVVVVVGTRSKSLNSKTGGMLQSYIIVADRHPVDILNHGLDGSICGLCPHRSIASGGKGSCYVNVGQGVASVWKAYQRGVYPRLDADAGRALVASTGRPFRIGTYGDPAAVPNAALFWNTLTAESPDRTGYTHQWRTRGASLKGLVMASVDSINEMAEAQSLGWATFRVAPVGSSHRLKGEAICPASAEAGKRVTCATCPMKCNGALFNGNLGRVIQAHGSTRARI